MPKMGNPGRPVEELISCRAASELLKVDQCEQVIELLRQAQATSKRMGDMVRSQILAVAHRTCLACRQSRSEVEWHRRALEEASQRESELKEQFRTILNLIAGGKETGSQKELFSFFATDLTRPERESPQSLKRPSLWQRLQSLLGRGPLARGPESESAVVSVEARNLSPTDKAERPTVPLSMPEREAITVPLLEKEQQGEQASPTLVVYCLGPFRLYQNDRLITAWNSLKGQCILKYLVAHGGRPIAKDIFMDLFWRDSDPEAARRNLHQAIYSLRQTLRRGHLGFQHIQFENDCYLLNPEMDIWLDSEEFERHVQVGRRLEAASQLVEAMVQYGIAEGLYQGDFLEEDLYQDWSRVRREHIRAAYFDIAGRLSEYYAQQGEYTAAIALCQKVLARDNCREEAHHRLMRCYLAQGQRHLAVRQYQACVQALKEELALAPSEDTVALYRRITTA